MPGTCARVPDIAIAWLDAPVIFEAMAYGDRKKAAYLAINPKGKVPALRFEDGDVLTEAAAILTWLSAAHGGEGYARDTVLGRREAEALSYVTSEVHADFGPHFAVEAFAGGEAAREEVEAATDRKLAEHYEWLDRDLRRAGDWYLGERSFVDAYLHVLTRWIDRTPKAIDEFPNLAAHGARMQEDAGVHLAFERPDVRPL